MPPSRRKEVSERQKTQRSAGDDDKRPTSRPETPQANDPLPRLGRERRGRLQALRYGNEARDEALRDEKRWRVAEMERKDEEGAGGKEVYVGKHQRIRL